MSDISGGGPAYGFYGDDFTGATDTLAHLARAGLRTMLFFVPPDAARLSMLGRLDAIGIAGAARTMPPHAAAAGACARGGRVRYAWRARDPLQSVLDLR